MKFFPLYGKLLSLGHVFEIVQSYFYFLIYFIRISEIKTLQFCSMNELFMIVIVYSLMPHATFRT
jgi:hypothetical protein